MYEMIPIVAGICAGLIAMAGGRRRRAVISAIAVVAGTTAAVLSGELSDSWLFLLWDIAQALVCGYLVLLAGTRIVPAIRHRNSLP